MQKALDHAVYEAAYHKHASTLGFLFENGASTTGYGSLLPAALRFPPDPVLLQVMYEHGWDAEQIDKDMARDEIVIKDLTEWLLDHGMDPNLKGRKGLTGIVGDMTPMNAAALGGRTRAYMTTTMDLLHSRGASLGPSVLVNAVGWRSGGTHQPKVLQWLVDHGADVNCAMPSGTSILEAAIAKRNAALVRFLLENGADPDHLGKHTLLDDDDNEGEGRRIMALRYALEMQADEICDILRNHVVPQDRQGA
ncbi:hypothetical protein PG996_015586 [Apiospora saccharicola]|uniref:Ankyrin n=1 Tax=Apiospora saccharicola TaxID=335842 RepID=A0ABR1TLN2_9PEZI